MKFRIAGKCLELQPGKDALQVKKFALPLSLLDICLCLFVQIIK